MPKITLLLSFCLLLLNCGIAQTGTFYFSPLSSTAYAPKILALKGRVPAIVYTDKKQQKAYAEIIAGRDKSLIEDFEENQLIDDTMLLHKCNTIISKMKAANPAFPFNNITVYINRSCVANASCFGEGTLFVNMGLFLWIDNDDELALIIGHELSHQFLNHAESRIKNNIALLSSDEFIAEMKAIKKSQDGKYERYKKLMKDMVTENGTHSRYKETEADSLGLILTKNAGYNTTAAAQILLKLNNVEDLFDAGNIYSVKAAFEKSGADSLVFRKNSKYHGLSNETVTMSADKGFDSIKTHPDCVVRYKKLVGQTAEKPVIKCCTAISPFFKGSKERALIELVRYEYEKGQLTLCAHVCLFALQNGYTGSFYNAFLSLCFSGIYAADKKFQKFSVTDSKAKANSTLKELQDMIFNTNSDNIATIANYFLSNAGSQADEDYLFAKLMYNKAVTAQDEAGLAKHFTTNFPHSKYIYLLNTKKP